VSEGVGAVQQRGKMIKPFKAEANNYTLYGVLFGLLFPIGATIVDSSNSYGSLTWANILKVQSTNVLIWIIDSAPFWLGLFARIGGVSRDHLLIQKNKSIQISEIAFKQKEERLNTIINNTTSVIYMKDAEGRYTFVNRRWENLFSITNEEMAGKSDNDIFPRDIAEKFVEHDNEVIKSGKPFEGEEIAPHKDGTHNYISVKVPLFDSSGVVTGLCGISTDITDQKRAENLSTRLGRILDSSFNEVYIFDAETFRFIQVSYGACRNLNYSKEEMTHLTPIDLKPEFSHEFFEKLIKPLRYKQEKMVVFETVHKRKNGTMSPVSVRLQLMHDESAPVFLAIIEDISKRKHAEEKILSESKFASENPFPVMRVSNEGKFIYLNKTADLICLKYDCQIDHGIPSAWVENLHKVLSTEEAVEFEDDINGRWYAFNMVPIKGMNYVNIYGLDITLRKEAENELNSFAAIASHDLQEPLRKISVFGERIAESAVNLDEKSRDYLQRMQNASMRMSHFIEDLLNYSKVSAQSSPYEKIDLEESVQAVIGQLDRIIKLNNGSITISNLPKLEGIKSQIDQVFSNLIINSLKYKRKDELPVVNIFGRKKENGTWEIVIEDNGIGFDEKYAERIFQPFQRLHGRSEYEGSGLGLTICKKIVDRHNGTLSVKSKPNEGTTFIMVLPENQRRTNLLS
jgi:two-component system, LuxR family, sensor kinase FixL